MSKASQGGKPLNMKSIKIILKFDPEAAAKADKALREEVDRLELGAAPTALAGVGNGRTFDEVEFERQAKT